MAPKQSNISNRKHLAHMEVVRRQTLAIRYTAIAIVVLVVGLVVYGIAGQSLLLPFRDVAKVNGQGIKASQFFMRVKFFRLQLVNQYNQILQFGQMFGFDPTTDPQFSGQLQQIGSQLDPAAKVSLGQTVLDTMINEALIRQEAAKRAITVSAAEVDSALQASFRYYPNGTPSPTVTPTTLVLPTLNPTELALVTITPTATLFATTTSTVTPTADLSATPTSLPTATLAPTATQVTTPTATGTALPTVTPFTLQGYQTQVADTMGSIKKGTDMDLAGYRVLLENQLLRTKLTDIITADVKPVQEQVWARHILVATEDDAKKVEARLANGEDWSKVAAEVSQDTSNKDKGGDLGWFARGVMVKDFEDAAFAQKAGVVGPPVNTSFGWHIIQVIAHEDRPLTADAFQQAKQAAFDAWLKQAHDAATITNNDFWKELVPAEPTLPGAP